ncbi:MAG TPA: NADH-quinone oxidoreductase subunit NuoH [Acidimicrobiia bacterium]|nr:NADH-quinone oxidoreductase subunit NuoH [Acidimicrobiia bacterium]
MPWAQIGIVALRVILVFALLLGATVINVWAERKVIADMQSRIGPKRAGPWGILQTVADGLKLFFKESITPRKVEVGMFLLAPFLAVVPAFLIFMMVPFGAPFTIGGDEVILQGADLNIGLLFILAMSSMAVYAVVLAGWSSGSKYPLIGGIRATAQAISYEAAMGLAMVSVVMFTATQGDGGTLSLAEIVARQEGTWGGFIPRWNAFPQIVAFVIFMIAIVAETNRAPFDLVEAEQEIVGGYHTEYSGMRFAMFFLAEYVNIFSMSAIAATLFLGGWNGPTWEGSLPTVVSALLPTVWFLIKTYAIVFVFFWLRATLPRLRYDQLMTLGWKRLIPAALTWIMVSAVAMGVRQFGFPWVGG